MSIELNPTPKEVITQCEKVEGLTWDILHAEHEKDITEIEHRICLECGRGNISVEKRILLLTACKEFRHARAK